MFLSKIKVAAAFILAVGVLTAGTGVIAYRAQTAAFAQAANGEPSTQEDLKKEIESLKQELDRKNQEIARLSPEVNLVRIPSQREGVISFLGTEIKDGEKVPPERIVTVKLGGKEVKFRPLKIGDRVESGQLLGRVDDRLARDEMAIKEKKLLACKAELETTLKTRDEAKARYDTQVRLKRSNATSEEDVSAAKLTWEKYIYEVISKKAAIAVADSELTQAQTIVEMHEIRSRVSGVIKAIYKHTGEGVKTLEPVFLIQIAKEPD